MSKEKARKLRKQSRQEQPRAKKPKGNWGKYRGEELFQRPSQDDYDCLRAGAIQMRF